MTVASVAVGSIGQVEIGKGDRTGLADGAALGDRACHVDRRDDRRVVRAGDEDRDILRVGATVAVVDRDREHQRDRLANSQEVEVRIGDGVIPVDGTVVGVAAGGRDREGILERGLLGRGQRQGGGDGRRRLGRGRAIGQIEIREGDRTGLADGAALGNRCRRRRPG